MIKKFTVRDYMVKKLISVPPGMDIHRAIKVILKHKISGVPVVDEKGVLVGVLSRKDCLKVAFHTSYHQDKGGPVSDYMSSDVETIDPDMEIVEVAELFLKKNYRRYPVIERGHLVGQIGQHDALKAIDELW